MKSTTYRVELKLNKHLCLILLLNFAVSSFLAYKATSLEKKLAEKEGSRIDPVFLPYVNSFISSAAESGVDLKSKLSLFAIKFNDKPQRKLDKKNKKDNLQVGWCMLFDREIAIDKDYWNKSNESARQTLLDHELGHCLLGRVHLGGTIRNKKGKAIPKSIMLKSLVSSEVYEENKDYYRKELFGDRNQFDKLEEEFLHPKKIRPKDDVSASTTIKSY